MKIAYNWLNEYVKTSLEPEKLADRFVYTSSEVEDIINWESKYQNMVIGDVVEWSKHPDADKLSIVKVDIGEKTPLDIVCGAPNARQGIKVVVAKIGAKVYDKKGNSITIKEAKIRGQKSEGMLCSAEELGLADKSEGIMELPLDAPIGAMFSKYYGLDDTVLDLEITPNRPDLMSYLGLAREVSTFEKKDFQEPDLAIIENQKLLSNPITIDVIDSKNTPRFSTIYIENYNPSVSPIWMQSRLRLSGIKPISLIVDVANYVMLEMGQPIHTYDYEKIALVNNKKGLRVRNAKKGEKLHVLDNTERELSEHDIIVADTNDQPLVIAGVIGGRDTAISAETSKIVIEAATFSGSSIRNTSRRHGIRTESSSRFEKGIDPELTIKAIKRLVYLLQSIQPTVSISNITDNHSTYKKQRPHILLTFNKINQIIGANIPSNEIKNILLKLGFQVNNFTKSGFETVPPTWRADVALVEDVVEELVRIWGYDRIPITLPSGNIYPPKPNEVYRSSNRVRRLLASLGYNEAIHISLTSAENIQKSGISKEEAIFVELPLSKESECLIPSHLPNFMKNIADTNHLQSGIKMFEIGRIFHPKFKEEEVLSIVTQVQGNPEDQLRDWKADLIQTIKSLGETDGLEFVKGENKNTYYQANTVQDIIYAKEVIGQVGLIDSKIVNNYKIKGKKSILFAQIKFASLANIASAPIQYKEPLSFPSVQRDSTLIVDNRYAFSSLDEYIAKIKPSLLISWKVSSIYKGTDVPENGRAISINFEYNGITKSLTDEEVNVQHQKMIEMLIKQFNITIK